MCSAWRNSWRTGKVLPPVTWSGSRRVMAVALVVYVHTFHAIVVNFDHFWFLHGPRWNNYASPQVNFRIWSSVCGNKVTTCLSFFSVVTRFPHLRLLVLPRAGFICLRSAGKFLIFVLSDLQAYVFLDSKDCVR